MTKFLFFIGVPLIELMFFWMVGDYVGFSNAFLLLIPFFVLAWLVLRRVGVDLMKRLITRIQMREQLDEEMMGAALRLFSGLLLMFPGFITGIIGVVLLLPGLHGCCVRSLVRRGIRYGQPSGSRVIQGDFRRVADNDEVHPKQ